MIYKNIWKPDTCDCEIEYEWDDAQEASIRVHTASRIIKACPAHTGSLDKFDNYSKVMDENTRKNILLGKILENVPSAVQDILQSDGTLTKQLKKGLEYKYSFDKDRILEVNLAGFTVLQKEAVRLLADALFPNKVKIL